MTSPGFRVVDRLRRISLVPIMAFAVSPAAAEETPTFKFLISKTGAYRVDFESLQRAGLKAPVPSDDLALTNAGAAVPLWVADGGDGLLGPGDWVEFLGEHLRGEHSFFSEYSRFNVYFLRTDGLHLLRMKQPSAAETAAGEGGRVLLRRRQHLEEDLLILRLPPAENGEPEELWYWSKLVHNQKEPFALSLDLADLDRSADRTVDLEIHLRGWSNPHAKPDPEMDDHRVEVWLNGEELASAEWNGTRPHVLEIPALPAERFVKGDNTLAIAVPSRFGGEEGAALIDVVMLNGVDIAYPRDHRVGDDPVRFEIDDSPLAGSMPVVPFILESDAGRGIVVFGDQGSRSMFGAVEGDNGPAIREFTVDPFPRERVFVATEPDDLLTPDAVFRDRPSRLTDEDHRADYIVIAHPALRDEIEPLVDFHRSRGLEVVVVDVEDVYDEFGHGVVHPKAIRLFLEHAYRSWQRPAARFVLLVGDASWDGRNENAADLNYADWTYRPGETADFVKNTSTPYPEDAEINHRGLIPTWNHSTFQGHSASDNYFVSFDDGDFLPDMAIGRLPVVEPEEVARIVAKTIGYAQSREVGPWRRSALLITNENRGFQRQSDRLAYFLSSEGFASQKVYPASTEASNEAHTKDLIEIFDRGQLLVHFLGHGGRYVWRTGPPDLEKNHDLFTLDHLDELAPTNRLPVVLSLTCYSAPFDHPSADSIGEKLLRLDDRGAVAVFAASWRNNPSPQWGRVLLAELTVPGTTVGEAVVRAKHRIGRRIFVETYNLLGDPAVRVAAPEGPIELRAEEEAGGGGPLRVRGSIGHEVFNGRVIIDVVGRGGERLRTVEMDQDGPEFETRIEIGLEDLAAARVVRAYAWDDSRSLDAAGAVELPGKDPKPRHRRRPLWADPPASSNVSDPQPEPPEVR